MNPQPLMNFDGGIPSRDVKGVAKAQPSSKPSVSDFLRTLFHLLDENQIRYCVLHSWNNLPDQLSSDLDLAVHPSDFSKLGIVFRRLQDLRYQPVQCLNYFANAYYFVFIWFDGNLPRPVAVDAISDHRRSGLILTSGKDFVATRRRENGFWVASPEMEFSYLLAKKAWKGTISPEQSERFRLLVERIGKPQAESIARKIFLGDLSRRIVEACSSGTIGSILHQIKPQLLRTSLARHPWNLIRFSVGEAVRVTRRWFRRTGLFVVVLGPDGVGKTTLVNHLAATASPVFRRSRVFHWRPMSLWPQKSTATGDSPHQRPGRHPLAAVACTLGHFLDYWVGYVTVIRPLLAKSGLVVFDRYFHDALVDPRRYRYSGPRLILSVLSHLVPKPDLVLVLDASEEVVLSRKQELAAGEVQRQRQNYLALADDLTCARIINADRPIIEIEKAAKKEIAEYLAERFYRQHRRWLRSTGSHSSLYTPTSISCE